MTSLLEELYATRLIEELYRRTNAICPGMVKTNVTIIGYLSVCLIFLNFFSNFVLIEDMVDNAELFVHLIVYINITIPFILIICSYALHLHYKYEEAYAKQRILDLMNDLSQLGEKIDSPDDKAEADSESSSESSSSKDPATDATNNEPSTHQEAIPQAIPEEAIAEVSSLRSTHTELSVSPPPIQLIPVPSQTTPELLSETAQESLQTHSAVESHDVPQDTPNESPTDTL